MNKLHPISWLGKSGKTVFVPSALDGPRKRKKPTVYFIGSMGDVFHESVKSGWIDDIMKMIADCPQHYFLILTKRPEQMAGYMAWWVSWHDEVLYNLGLGVSVSTQAMADEYIPILLKTYAAMWFVSMEPFWKGWILQPILKK